VEKSERGLKEEGALKRNWGEGVEEVTVKAEHDENDVDMDISDSDMSDSRPVKEEDDFNDAGGLGDELLGKAVNVKSRGVRTWSRRSPAETPPRVQL